jgi:hypothetical protein
VVRILAAYIGPKNDRTLGISTCDNIEADDACAIARVKYGDMYSKITIASPDKDLLQIADTWFYDYSKRTTIFCNETVSLHKFCHQLMEILQTISQDVSEQELRQLLLK